MARHEKVRDTGEVDVAMTAWREALDRGFPTASSRPPRPPRPTAVEHGEADAGGRRRWVEVHGSDMSPTTSVTLDGIPLPTDFIDATRVRATYEAGAAGGAAVFSVTDDPRAAIHRYVDDVPGPIGITGVCAEPEVPRSGEPFELVVSFAPTTARPSFVEVVATYPDGERRSGVFRLSGKEREAGVKRIGGFSCGWGRVRFEVTAFGEGESAASCRIGVDVVPSNPVQLSVFPTNASLSGIGAAEYDPGDQLYTCRAQCVFANGTDFEVDIFHEVWALVREDGGLLTAFNFSMGRSYSMAPNSTRTIQIRTFYGNSATSAVLDRFGEIEVTLMFATSYSPVLASARWVAMAQLPVACMFVGDFTPGQRSALQSLVLTEASAIYERVDLTLSGGTIQLLPQSHPDWDRFRVVDIGCKNGGATSGEANDLRSGWSTTAPGVDIFFVESFSTDACATGALGFAPTPGPDSKSGPNSGVVIALGDYDPFEAGDAFVLGIGIAHELGHYMGLDHWPDDTSNFMHANAFGVSIEEEQVDVIRAHPSLRRLP